MTEEETKKIKFLNDLITDVSYLLDEYDELYTKNEDQLELLNLVAAAFFHQNQIHTLNTITSQLCKLLDPIMSCGHENLCIRLLAEFAERYNWPCFEKINENIDILINSTEFLSLKNRRNKWLSHNDSNHLIDGKVEPINIDNIRMVLKGIQFIMNCYHIGQRNCEVEFVPISQEGSISLIDRLSDFHIYSKLKEERGDFSQDWAEREKFRHECFQR